jgi:hypothetical protein
MVAPPRSVQRNEPQIRHRAAPPVRPQHTTGDRSTPGQEEAAGESGPTRQGALPRQARGHCPMENKGSNLGTTQRKGAGRRGSRGRPKTLKFAISVSSCPINVRVGPNDAPEFSAHNAHRKRWGRTSGKTSSDRRKLTASTISISSMPAAVDLRVPPLDAHLREEQNAPSCLKIE